MDVSSTMTALGARQLATVLGETTSQQAMGTALRLLRWSAEVARTALPGDAGLEWRELANKLDAFDGFQEAGRVGASLGRSGVPLAEQVRRASGLGLYRALWATEGLGYAHALGAWTAGPPPRRLLADGAWPDRAAIPLHTGAALAFAGRLLDQGEDLGPAGLERWLALWDDNALSGLGDLAVEALGLMARNLHPYRMARLAEGLRAIDPALDEPFWHGVGRGLYFAPTHALPWSGGTGRAFAKAWREPPHEPGRLNATAGLAWAFALVNIRHPEVLADVLERWGAAIGSAEAFANGVAAAVLVWVDAVGRDRHLDAFLEYRPAGFRVQAARWHELVLAPCETALRQTGPRLQAGLFRFAPPGEGASAT